MNGINEHFIPCVKSWNIKNQISGDMVRVCVCGRESHNAYSVYLRLVQEWYEESIPYIGMNALWN